MILCTEFSSESSVRHQESAVATEEMLTVARMCRLQFACLLYYKNRCAKPLKRIYMPSVSSPEPKPIKP